MLVECWASVTDGAPGFKQHCVNIYRACWIKSCIDLTLSSPRFDDGGGQRDGTTGHLFIDLPFRLQNLMTEADIRMTEHGSKTRLG